MSAPIDDATLAEIESELLADGVWIDPAFARAHQISAADEAAIEEAVASVEHADLRVVLVEVPREDDRFQGSFAALSAWIQDDLGGDAIYLGQEPWGQGDLHLAAFGDQPSTAYVSNVAFHEHPDDVTDQVLRVTELLEEGTAPQLWEQVPREERYPWTADEGGLPSWEWIVGGLVLAAVAATGALITARRRRRRTPGFTLPTAVLRTVRAAEDRQLRQRAELEVLTLGEALGGGEPAVGAAETLTAWQAALDHYQTARAVLDRAGSPADVVGALVLVRRGEHARQHADAGGSRGWRPPLGCYFHPLHDGPVSTVTWDDDGRSVEVPACTDCADAVRDGREPDDVLDFVESDRTVHYYRLDLGVWSSTGYGSLEPDLLGALLRQGRRRRR